MTLIFGVFYWVTRSGPTPFYEPSVQAQAFLHGKATVDAPGYMEEIGPICNLKLPVAANQPECRLVNATLVHPPMAALIMMPVVWWHGLDGADCYQVYVSIVVGAITVGLMWHLLQSVWLTLLFGVGTTFWYEATMGASWDFVLTCSVPFTILALSTKKPQWVGLWAGLAALARYDLCLAWPFYVLMVLYEKGCDRGWLYRDRGRPVLYLGSALVDSARTAVWMLPGFSIAATGYLVFSLSRYGTLYDKSLWLWYRCCDGGGFHNPAFHLQIPGPFSFKFLPTNLYTALALGYGYVDYRFPYIHPQGAGMAIWMITPAFILAARAPLRHPRTWLLLGAALAVMVPSLLVYSNGIVQFGPRYWVQVYPFLMLLIASGSSNGKTAGFGPANGGSTPSPEAPDQLAKVLIVASIFAVSFGIYQIRVLGYW